MPHLPQPSSTVTHASPEDIWLHRPVAKQVRDTVASYRDLLGSVIAELCTLAAEKPAITVGADSLPELAVGLRALRTRSAWAVPSQTFQRHHCGHRESHHEIVQETSDPDRARKNWMDRDAAFAREVAR
jgi:hypothetical protein